VIGVHSLLLNVRKACISNRFYEFLNKCEDADFRDEKPSNFTCTGQFSNNGDAPTNNHPYGLYTTVHSTVDNYGVSLQLTDHFAQFL
jgi:hypothetical protein